MTEIHLRKERLENITATEMSSILGLNPYKTGAGVRLGKLDPQKIVSIHLRRGTLLEPAVLEALKEDLGWETIRHEGPTIVMPNDRIAATPDAYLKDGSGLVECKSIGYKTFEKWYIEPPTPYVIQSMVQMMVTELPVCYLAALEAGDPYSCEWRLVVWKINRNSVLEDIMKREVSRFWELFSEEKSLRATESIRGEIMSLLRSSYSKTYPEKYIPLKENKDAEEVSRILSLFK